MPDTISFAVSINDGPEQPFETRTGVYVSTAAAVPAMFGIEDFPVKVKIWAPHLLPDYPGFTYLIDRWGGRPMLCLPDFERPILTS